MMKNRLISAFLFSLAMIITTGCSIGEGTDSNITMSLRVSAFSYVKDNNETNETNITINGVTQGYYISRGRYDFYDENISGERRIEKGIFEYDVNCSDFNIEQNTTAPILKAPDKNSSGSIFAYVNINPFTTLMVEEHLSADELNAKYLFTAAYDVDPDFNFDTFSARYDRYLPEETADFNLTDDICRALKEVMNLQP
jgi:hypothetical protein